MNCSPTLSSAEFSDVHNAKCELHSILQSIEGVVHPNVQERLEKAIELLNKGLASAYKQDDEAFQQRHDHFDEVSNEFKFKSIWSLDEVSDLRVKHPFDGAEILAYSSHWGPGEVKARINGDTWVDLWAAADEVIKLSGDNHHIFIEAFERSKFKNNHLELSTGS
jgi:hypothetical protein